MKEQISIYMFPFLFSVSSTTNEEKDHILHIHFSFHAFCSKLHIVSTTVPWYIIFLLVKMVPSISELVFFATCQKWYIAYLETSGDFRHWWSSMPSCKLTYFLILAKQEIHKAGTKETEMYSLAFLSLSPISFRHHVFFLYKKQNK